MKKQKNRWIVLLIGMFVIAYGLQIVYHQMTRVDEVPIIGYHHIVEDQDKEAYYKNNMWVNTLSSFEAQMKLLHDEGYHSVTMEELYQWRMGEKELDPKSIVITFDDGFYSSIYYAQPILEKYGFTGTVFVIGSQIDNNRTGYIPQKRQHASLQDMEDVKNMEFYSHSYDLHHKKDGFKVDLLNKEELMADTQKEKDLVSIDYYAYPYGKYNDNIQQVLQESGTKLAFGFNENRKAKITDDPYALPRFNVNAYTKLDVFLQMIEK